MEGYRSERIVRLSSSIIWTTLFLTTFSAVYADLKNETRALLDIKQKWGNPDVLVGWNTTTPTCSWPFVTCDSDNTQIALLELSNLSLSSGAGIPEEIGELLNLEYLTISNCGILGEISSSIGLLEKLEYLDLSYNTLTGSLPMSLANLTILNHINVSNNHLRGEIPYSLWNNTLLSTMDMSFNHFQGNLPYNISFPYMYSLCLNDNKLSGYLPDLSQIGSPLSLSQGYELTLKLGRNMFMGSIPTNIGFLEGYLSFLSMEGNKISGNIPASLGNCTNLSLLDLRYNKLTGIVPTSLQSIQTLQVFMVGSNRLEGDFPSWITQSPLLKILDLSNNHFHGTLPTIFSGLYGLINASLYSNYPLGNGTARKFSESFGTGVIPDNLVLPPSGLLLPLLMNYLYNGGTSFDISSNNFGGRIPDQLGILEGLLYLDLSRNKLSGDIPESFGNLLNLEYLDLSSNELSGQIPLKFTSLNFLSHFDVSRNNVSGPIPSGGQFYTFNNISSFRPGNVDLCGSPLPSCNSSTFPLASQYLSSTHALDKDTPNSVDVFKWVSIPAISLGFAIGFVLIFPIFLFYKKANIFIYMPFKPKYRYDHPYGAYIPRR